MRPQPAADPPAGDCTLLIEVPGIHWDAADAHRARRRVPDLEVDILTAVSAEETWFYIPDQSTQELDDARQAGGLLATMLGLGPDALPEFRCRRLTGLLELGDASHGRQQSWHYTSQTDVPETSEEEFNRWFDREHLPQLASLGGTVHAARYRTDGSPRYLACYDLTAREIQGSPEWRAAIESPWRDRMHHQFIGPRRLMLRRLH